MLFIDVQIRSDDGIRVKLLNSTVRHMKEIGVKETGVILLTPVTRGARAWLRKKILQIWNNMRIVSSWICAGSDDEIALVFELARCVESWRAQVSNRFGRVTRKWAYTRRQDEVPRIDYIRTSDFIKKDYPYHIAVHD